jgi:hypothetical protein
MQSWAAQSSRVRGSGFPPVSLRPTPRRHRPPFRAAGRAVLHRTGHPPGPPGRRDVQPRWCLDHPASPQPVPSDSGWRTATALCAPRPRREVLSRVRRRVPRRGCRGGRHAGPGAERERLRRALDPYDPRRVPRLAADRQPWSPGSGPPEVCRALQPTSPTPSAWAPTAWSIRRSDPGWRGSASPGAPTRPPWWPASRVPASCMNAFTHPTRLSGRVVGTHKPAPAAATRAA